ncbi:MAG: NADH:ubiquinone reductase (Na(+)-transporting) subunit C [Bacteroidales bacterium]|nr:NADH:ubiquinone reductase (Na(+)-transporting) subunit C [Bacteroidales bacterium]MBN2755745.1 NADH:ubiquinone reductase (Na(+)-transporting) subunit C [Bacteroidales bacterium]
MDTNGNLYTFIYASVLVIVVAAALSFTALKLQPIQNMNVKNEKMQNILASVHIESTAKTANNVFEKYITKSFVVNSKGEEIKGKAAFDINLKQEYKKDTEQRELPLYEATLEDGTIKLIIPLTGKGLWGPIWGYVALESDMNTLYGAVFDHKGETPGLGADINKDWFQKPFTGKTIFEDGKLIGIRVHKGGKGAALAANDTEHGVDAISGGTITSKALEAMIFDCISSYKTYLENNKK